VIAHMDNTKGERELVIKRTFDAPRALVWQAWTDPKYAKAWGPKGFTTPVREMGFIPGDPWRSVMISPDGKELRQHGVLREIAPQELISFTSVWDDHPEDQTLVSVTFDKKGESETEMTFKQSGFASDESRDGHRGGWNEAFDALAGVVSSLAGRS
jgi:uncharacterized protein YndB with AHSA1/START domain